MTTASSFYDYCPGWVYDWKARATNGYDAAKSSEDCLTTTSLSRLFAQRQCSALTGGDSWFPSALLNVPWRLGERAICCFACFLSLLPIDLANCCQSSMALTQSCYVTEGFGMVLLPLLRLLYGP